MPKETFEAADFAGFAISEDGATVRLLMSTNVEGQQVHVTMPITTVPMLFAHIGQLMDSLLAAGLVPAEMGKPARNVTTWEVGANSMIPGFTALRFDAGLTQETFLLMKDLDALKLADSIEQKVLYMLPPQQQRELIAAVEKANGRKPRLIVPGR